ncbi:eCIS core domain-containing protein [Nannocystis radixulma]|uniref:DUF4157 domain-containing protein n=1 Tax=Nannocystis radixulma TaxID=2995305 RepID=A0ABT5B322_9BACT|nr:DUF4157 domain-containing protein [Nannocystis radixulma]MDC0668501.1 DUF4157 domain-containing protein [Nannocystis radixulma]
MASPDLAPATSEQLDRVSGPGVMRACAACSEEKPDEEIQRRAEAGAGAGGSAVAAPLGHALAAERATGGTRMPDAVRAFMEPRFGRSFEDVRIHTGMRASALARQFDARAFTVGSDIFFRRDAYRPATAQGRRLIAHELAHTIQQGSRARSIQRSPATGASPPAPAPASTPLHERCSEAPWKGQESAILQAIADAKMRLAATLSAFEALAAMSDAARAQAWNAGAYHCWFGEYDERRFRRIFRNFRRTARVLGRKALHVDCGREQMWAEAWPANFKLTLHEDWLNATPSDPERTQSIIHEATHIAGVSIVKEDRFYGKTFSFLWARARPDLAVRNSDAYGYLAMDLLNTYPACN